MSAKKVTSWLWSNPVSGDGDVSEHSLQSKTTSKSKTKESKKASANASEQNKTKDTTSTGHGNETSKKSQESGSSSRKSEKVNSKKRRLADEFDQQSSSKAKKNKTKQSVNDEQMKRTTNEDKTPKTPKRAAPLSLPRTPKGLSALADDVRYSFALESECDTGSATKNMANPLKQKGFLSPFNKPRKRLTSSKTPKPQVKKLSSTQTTETIEPNSKERKFLDSGKMSLDALLNDKNINW
ncbi:uncharacterized protein LOC124433282 [Xenia sp. Carnegie-2017]|uniref:uncharacterized protein LOC124433282 n=1 Tax=Xenia sp. Carnegie-2017 TaxID=2897299 RepID=UPI001F040A2B|nr:uncharacterized protein LOC124433282 [Xenia sp. Carnegie-2017]